MTYKEKLMQDHPEYSYDVVDYIVAEECPSDKFFTATDPEYCAPYTSACEKCWDQEIPETPTEEKTVNELRAEHGLPPVSEPHILDSGDRTQFESGAVRDMREGKGRFDVMPMEVISAILNSPILEAIAEFQLTGETTHLYFAIERFTIDCYSKDPYNDNMTQINATMLLEVAKHYEEGAKKYSPDNWRKSIPVWCYIDSATRHYIKWLRGDTNEHHERAFIWNLMCCIWEVDYGDEWRKSKEESNENNQEA